MKATVIIGTALALLLISSRVQSQHFGGLFVSVGGGAMTFTNDVSLQSSQSPDNVGLVGQIGVQMSILNPRFRLGAEYELTTIHQAYTGPTIWCNGSPYFGQTACSGERANLRSLNLQMLWALNDVRARFQPYVSFGTGWISVPTHHDRETLGPKTDLSFGLGFDVIGNGLVQLAIEPRYTFFYFLERTDGIDPSHVSLTASTRVRLVR